MKKHKAKGLLYFPATLILAAIFVILSIILSSDFLGLLVNLAAVAIMTLLILAGLGTARRSGIAALNKAAAELRNATEIINDAARNPRPDKSTLENIRGRIAFRNHYLQDAFDSYLAEMERLPGEYQYCDIADFFNQELLDRVMRSSLNDFIGNSLTSLGILGTFVGMIIGLRSFSNSSAEEMLSTITPLIEGIKVAFLTSIFGLVFSLLFTHIYRDETQKAEAALETFTNAFYSKVNGRADNEGFSRLIQLETHQEELQTRQQESVENLAEAISESFARKIDATFSPLLNKMMETMTNEMPHIISQSVIESVVPTMEGIAASMDGLVKKIAETQDQSMVRIANEFVTHMNEAMGNRLTDLSESIQSLCRWQEEMSDHMRAIADGVSQSGSRLTDVNKDLAESTIKFDEYVTHLDEAQARSNEQLAAVLADIQRMADNTGSTNTAMAALLREEKQSLENIRHIDEMTRDKLTAIRNVFEEFTHMITAANQAQIDAIGTAHTELTDSLRTQEAKISQALEQQAQGLAQSLKLQLDSLQGDVVRIDQLQQAITQNVNTSVAAFDRSSGAIVAASEDLSGNLTAAMASTYREIDEQLAAVMTHFSATLTQMRETIDRLPRVFSEYSGRTEQQIADYIKQAAQFSEQTNRQMTAFTERTTGYIKAIEQDITTLRNLAAGGRR